MLRIKKCFSAPEPKPKTNFSHFRLFSERLNRIHRNLTGSKISTSSTKFLCRLRSIATHRDHFVCRLSVGPSVCLSVRPSVCLSVCHTRMAMFRMRHMHTSECYHYFCFSDRSEKQDGRPCLWFAEIFPTSPLKPLNGIQRNLTGSKIATSSTKCVIFGPIKMTALVSDLLRQFRLLWNHWTEFKKIW